MAALLIIGCMALIGGCVSLIIGRDDMRRRRRILGTPTSRIIDAAATATVEIQGRIAPGEEGTVKSSFGEKSVVWFRTTIEEPRGKGRWYSVFNESDGRPFYVDDGSGEAAKIIPSGAKIILDERILASFGKRSAATPEVEAFLKSRGVKSTRLGFRRVLRIVEQTLAPGNDLYALGPARREPIVPAHDGDPTAQATRLVLSQGDGEKGELILTKMTKQELAKRLRSDFTLGVGFAALGAVLVLLHFVIG